MVSAAAMPHRVRATAAVTIAARRACGPVGPLGRGCGYLYVLMARGSRCFVALVTTIACLVISVMPAEAATSSERRRRDEARRRKAEAAAKVDALKASDAELERAVAALDSQLKADSAKAAAARQAVVAAEAQVASIESELARTIEQTTRLETVVRERAVAAYMRPQQSNLEVVLDSASLADAGRRQQMLTQVANTNRDAIDELRAVREDAEIKREQAETARQRAADRRKAAERQVQAVASARAEKVRAEKALEGRIAAFQAEVDGLSREEAALTSLIQQREAAARERASRSAGAAAAAPAGRVSGAGLIWPVRGSVTSEYGPRWGRMHEGIDIAAPTGTPIRAAKAGEVIFVGSQGGYGNITIVDHGGGFTTVYPHQSRFGTSEGAQVSQGQVIGYVGCSGSCTGPHLHFETRVSGSAQNPRRYLP